MTPLTVYYDGACPLCAREIEAYRRQRGADSIVWIDAARCERGALGTDLRRDDALARLHVRRTDGTLVSGAAAFAALWQQLPALGTLGRLAARRPFLPVLEAAYNFFLWMRPLWRGAPELPAAEVFADLRSDHAGEAGAVAIYKGILAATRDPELRKFAQRHLATERRHLAKLEELLVPRRRSRLLPLWRLAGWLTGALPALAGARAVFATIAAVETFVDRHYGAQLEKIDRLDPAGRKAGLQSVRALLDACRRDEIKHRDEAASRLSPASGAVLRLWCRLVAAGSAAAVAVSRRI